MSVVLAFACSAESVPENIDDAGVGLDASYDDAQPQAPGYMPFALASCEDGPPGEPAVGLDALRSTEGPTTLYSDEVRVDDVGQSCESFAQAGENYFGGYFQTPGIDVGAGQDLWMRQALYFPKGTCFGHGSGGDGWGVTKWMRIEFDNGGPAGSPGDRLTLQLGNMALDGCNPTATIWGASREYAGVANARPGSDVHMQAETWHMLQWQVHLATDDSGFIRFWLNEQFVGQWDGQTVSAESPRVSFIAYGDYWNGTPFQDLNWYLDEVIMTTETPDTLDSEGRPYIAPSARVADWR